MLPRELSPMGTRLRSFPSLRKDYRLCDVAPVFYQFQSTQYVAIGH
jgi:hypothetical protein